jgi:hypothetical protein
MIKKLSTLILSAIVIIVLLGSIFLIISYIKQKSEIRSRATVATVLSMSPASTLANPIRKFINDPLAINIKVKPATSLVSLIHLEVSYDPTKLLLSPVNPVIINSTAFPVIMEGPIFSPGKISLTASIGQDPTKAITNETDLATVNFIASGITNTAITAVSFNHETQVLSIGPNDQASENVLSSTLPGFIRIDPIPTPIPSPVMTSVQLTVFLHGIGESGDSTNPTSSNFSNKNPLHKNRSVMVEIYNSLNILTASSSGTIGFTANGNFNGQLNFENALPAGNYLVKVKTPMYLKKALPNIQTLKPGNNTLPIISMVAGDVISDNKLDILDYNILRDCYSDLLPPGSCNTDKKLNADLTDDGKVNQYDYNLFLREINVQNGD